MVDAKTIKKHGMKRIFLLIIGIFLLILSFFPQCFESTFSFDGVSEAETASFS